MAEPGVSLWYALLLFLTASPAPAQVGAPRDTSPLEFFGFRAGAPLQDVDARVRALTHGRLRCKPSRADRRVTECRALLASPELGHRVELWLSAIDSQSSILTLAADMAPGQLDRWRLALEQRYGQVGSQIQGPQRMMQWVRRGRMIRLTWRTYTGKSLASVSLVDGQILDGWQAPRPDPRPSR